MSPPRDFTIIAHRGHQGLAPELTIQAFDAAVAAGFPHIELDVQTTSCGQVIVLHDELLGRTVAGSGHVGDASWQDLKLLDAGSWYTPCSPDWAHCRVPTLEEVLTRYHGRVHLHVELKSKQEGLPAAVARTLQACAWVDSSGQPTLTPTPAHQQQPPSPADASAPSGPALSGGVQEGASSSAFLVPGLTITSFHLTQLAASKQLLPGVRHAWLIHEISDEALQAASEAGVSQLCPRANLLTAPAVAAAKAKGFSVRAWGLKEEQNVVAAVRCGAQGGTADYPDKTAALLATL